MRKVPYDPEAHNGMINPYTSLKISDEASYCEYMREYVWHRLCESNLRKEHGKELELRETHLRKEYNEQITLRENRLREEYNIQIRRIRIRARLRFSALFLVFLFVLFVYLPSRENAALEEGERTGYDTGYADGTTTGYNAGLDDGFGEGYDEGYGDGYNGGYDDGYGSGYVDGLTPRGTNTQTTTPHSSTETWETVYVSLSGGKIHTRSNCSGMQYYSEMSYADACAAGYNHCSKCF